MKEQLHKLGDKIAADPMAEQKKTQAIISQVKELCKKIDELSSGLNPEFRQEYLS
jgi:hypothetical protein